MGEGLIEFLIKFDSLVCEGRLVEAEELAVKKAEREEVDRVNLVGGIIADGVYIENSKMFQELERRTFALSCFRIGMKINRQKRLRKTIRNLVAQAHCNLGLTFFKSGKLKEAEASFREALKINPKLLEAHFYLGNTLGKLGRLEEAEASYREALKINPKLSEAHNNLGSILSQLGRLEEAEASYREAIKINPREAKLHGNLGSLLGQLGKLKEAEASYREAIKINPKFSEVHYNLGVTLYELGRLEEAEASYREAVKLNSKDVGAISNLGFLLFVTDRRDEAKPHLNLARKIFVEKGTEKDVAYMEALIYWIDGFKLWQTGNLAEAENSYTSASKSFIKSGQLGFASIPTLIAEYFEIDKEYLSYITSGNLNILRNGILNLSRKIEKSLRKIRKIPFAEIEILKARATCIQFLKNTLLFKPVEHKQLEESKRVFSRYHFLEAYEGANVIDTFRNYLNAFSPHKDLNEIPEEQEKNLFTKLNPAVGLDGILTEQFARKVVEGLKPRLYSIVTKPIMEEGMKTREILTQKIGQIEEKLESIKVTLLGIEKEITIKKVAYGEYEIILPSPLGVYKIRIPAGEISEQDLIKIRTEISNLLAGAIELAKQTSTKLYNELKNKKQEITQKILTKIRKMRKQ